MKVGDKVALTKQFTAEDVRLFAELSTDKNPVHLDVIFARNNQFGKPIVHGMLVASLFSAILGTKLPGKGAIYLGQELSFKQPVFIGDAITASVEVIDIRSDKSLCTLRTVCHNSKGEMVIDGKAIAKY